jgi:adenine-specific DNA-methyltransferase
MIYIDPPYNTGKEFVYSDKFEFGDSELRDALGYTQEEVCRLKSLQGKSSHSAWLAFMYPRLKIAQKLLRDDGVIFISIDDNEQANLKLLCDEIFGEGNFVAQMIWERAYAPKNDAKYISNSHDYALMYAKSINNFAIGRLERTEEANARYQNPDNDPRGVWKPSDLSVKTYTPENDYPITAPSGRVIEPPAGRCWRLSKNSFLERLHDNRIYFGTNGNSVPCMKRFLTELKFDGMVPQSILFHKDVGHSQEGAQEFSKLMDGGVFEGPKPIRLLRYLLTLANIDKEENAIILDFFAGSGTTAHAVMQLNAEDGGNRRFIMVQLDEPTKEGSEARKAGYATIDEIARERIKRAGGSFRNFRCVAPPTQTIDMIEKFDPSAESQGNLFGSMAQAFGEETILQTWLLADGYEFGQTPEAKNFAGYRAHCIDGSLYIINEGWGTEQTRELLNLAGKNELRLSHIRIYGYSLGMESLRELKINVSQSLKNVETELRY